jgi:hypothetical protein
MSKILLDREFFGRQGYVRVKFFRHVDKETGREMVRIKGKKHDYRFNGETFSDLYAAQRYVADRIAEIDRAGCD